MNSFEKMSILIIAIQSAIILFAAIGAWFFGYNQKAINDRLSIIEKYRYEKEKAFESSKILEDKKQLRKLTIQIIDYYTWGAGTEKEEEVKTRTSEDKIEISKRIQILLDQGLDNDLLKNNKESLINWLGAYNMTEGILSSPSPLGEPSKKYIDGAFSEIFGKISAVHSSLKLSYTLIRKELQEQLKEN